MSEKDPEGLIDEQTYSVGSIGEREREKEKHKCKSNTCESALWAMSITDLFVKWGTDRPDSNIRTVFDSSVYANGKWMKMKMEMFTFASAAAAEDEPVRGKNNRSNWRRRCETLEKDL